MNFSSQDFEQSCRDYEENWSLLDQQLYGLCRQYPGHRNHAEINAKVNIIGKTYNTGIERIIKSSGEQGSSMETLADHIYNHRAEIDRILEALAPWQEPLDKAKLRAIVTQHGRFVELIKQITMKNKSPRSFAAKYLHFHCPWVPIYDSVVAASLASIVSWKKEYDIFALPKAMDEEYAWFVMRFFSLYQEARKVRQEITVKLVDHYLLWMATD